MAVGVDVRHRKRRRRRREDKPPITAKLVLDDAVEGDVGIVSADLLADLFPHQNDGKDGGPVDESNQPAPIHHVAMAPWSPQSTPGRISWTIVPVVKSGQLGPSTLRFSPSSLALQSFATTLQRVAPSRLAKHSRNGIEVLVLDVAALELDTVFVKVEGDLVARLENGEGTFMERPSANGKEMAASATPAKRLATALRIALGNLKVVHNGDLFPLPLPPHNVSHMPPAPGKVTLCDPVAQGILGSKTKVVLIRGHSSMPGGKGTASAQPLNGGHDDDAQDTANHQFYSAAKERSKAGLISEATDSAMETDTEPSEDGTDDDLSEDSLDDMISLQTPSLPVTHAGGFTTTQAGTPMTLTRGRKTNGMATPASVFSSFTATTARPGGTRGRLFKANGLARAIPPELLHPKPDSGEDEEARVYVDIACLSRVGCFSGDWVCLEASEDPATNGPGQFGLESFGQADEEPIWRPAKVYGLPEGYSQRRMMRMPSRKHEVGGRKLSFLESQVGKPSRPEAYLSPLLIANLGGTPYVRLSPLKRPGCGSKAGQGKITASSQPPIAREVVIQQIRSPLSNERALQTALIGGLKKHFARCVRVVKTGDVVGIPIDTQLGRTLQEASGGGDGTAVDDLLALASSGVANGLGPKPDGIAWFQIGRIQGPKAEHAEEGDEEEEEEGGVWGSVACIDTSTTQIAQSGAVTRRLPGTKDSNWPSYLGLEEPARSSAGSMLLSGQARPFISPLRSRLRELMVAATSKRAVGLKMPPVAILLLSTQRNIGKATVASKACADIGLHAFTMDAYDVVNESGAGGSDVKTELILRARAERAMSCGAECCALLIRHIEALTADRMVGAIKDILDEARVLIGTTAEIDKVPAGVRTLFTHELEMTAPDEAEREAILQTMVESQEVPLAPEVDLAGVAIKTAALVAGDLVHVVDLALLARQSRLETLSVKASAERGLLVTVRDIQVAAGSAASCLTRADFDIAVDAARKNFADAIGAPTIPNVTWDDVGGLTNVKEAVMETIQLPLERPEMFAKGMKKRSGILFYGPPGTGKTLLAKAIATEYSLNFFSVKGPELLNMYIGESEANVRRVFQRARDARPCVVFFDELDSVAPKRGNQGDSGGVMDRIVSQLLAELDGMSAGDDEGGGVFVIGATNRPDLLDQALLRPGRFDKMLYLGVSDTHDKQITIMQALTRKFSLHPTVSLASVAQQLPFTYTGADLYALCSDAMLKAVTRQARAVDAKIAALNNAASASAAAAAADPAGDQGAQAAAVLSTANFFDHVATRDDVAVMVTEQDFLDANRELIPSVSAGELRHYEAVRAAFEGVRGDGDDGAKGRRNDVPGAAAARPSRYDPKGKGKGKAVAVPEADGEEEEEEEYERYGGSTGKGKGKAVATFVDGAASDDEGLY